MTTFANAKILVTGAAGFIGSHLCERLVTEKAVVMGLDNFDSFYSRDIKDANVAALRSKQNFNLVEGDIRDAACVETILRNEKPDIIVHLAAKAGVRPSIENPIGYQDVNINGTAVLLEAARKFGIKNFVFASSSSVYGNNKKVPFAETDNVDFPISPYAATKKAGELICHTYSHLYNINITCLRFFTVYGPRQRPDLAIHKFTSLIDSGKPIPVFGDGSMRRDFTYIEDILDGVIAAMRNCKGYEIYNLGESRPVRLDILISEIENALGKKAIINRLPMQPGDAIQTYADVAKAKEKLGYEPKTELKAGLKEFIRWYRGTVKKQ
jgi:UDP-glucuronate 4-epimerase